MRILYILMLIVLAGCGNFQSKENTTGCNVIETRTVEVPVFADTPVVNVKRPQLKAAAADLMKPDELVKALEIDLTSLNAYTTSLEKALGIYKGN